MTAICMIDIGIAAIVSDLIGLHLQALIINDIGAGVAADIAEVGVDLVVLTVSAETQDVNVEDHPPQTIEDHPTEVGQAIEIDGLAIEMREMSHISREESIPLIKRSRHST